MLLLKLTCPLARGKSTLTAPGYSANSLQPHHLLPACVYRPTTASLVTVTFCGPIMLRSIEPDITQPREGLARIDGQSRPTTWTDSELFYVISHCLPQKCSAIAHACWLTKANCARNDPEAHRGSSLSPTTRRYSTPSKPSARASAHTNYPCTRKAWQLRTQGFGGYYKYTAALSGTQTCSAVTGVQKTANIIMKVPVSVCGGPQCQWRPHR